MISASQSKLIRSLSRKKFRDQTQLYVVEGEKIVKELVELGELGELEELGEFGELGKGEHRVQQLFATGEWIERNGEILHKVNQVVEASQAALNKVSNLVTPQQVIALVSMPGRELQVQELINQTVLAFESIRDPGNLGTILRTADWFGIQNILCTPDSTDVFNPKVIQATMGAIFRVNVFYCEIEQVLADSGLGKKAVYGTFLDGENIYEVNLGKAPLILFGNESLGLSDRFDPYIRQKIAIPSFSHSGKGSESLNVAASVAVLCSELRRMG